MARPCFDRVSAVLEPVGSLGFCGRLAQLFGFAVFFFGDEQFCATFLGLAPLVELANFGPHLDLDLDSTSTCTSLYYYYTHTPYTKRHNYTLHSIHKAEIHTSYMIHIGICIGSCMVCTPIGIGIGMGSTGVGIGIGQPRRPPDPSEPESMGQVPFSV